MLEPGQEGLDWLDRCHLIGISAKSMRSHEKPREPIWWKRNCMKLKQKCLVQEQERISTPIQQP
jgi:hypothetical protein